MSGQAVLWISSIPMFAIFVMGIYSVVLAIKIENELEARKKALGPSVNGGERAEGRENIHASINEVRQVNIRNQNLGRPVEETSVLPIDRHIIEILDIPALHDNSKCIICLDKESNAVFYPCGHQCVCYPCG